MRRFATALILLAFAAPLSAEGPKPKKPRLDLRATPRVAFSPTVVFVTAELQGGDDIEEFYCPELVWDWDDGGRSAHGEDCPPFEPGMELDRRFTAEHAYRRSGVYNVKVILRRSGRTLAMATATVNVRPGAGEMGGD